MRSWRLRSDPRQETGPFPRRLRDSDGPAKSPGLGTCCVPVHSRCKGPTSQLPAICRVAQVAVLMSAPNRAADAGNRPPNASKGSRRAFVLLSSSGDSPCGLCCRRQTGPKSPGPANLALSCPDLAGEMFGIFLPVIPIWPGSGFGIGKIFGFFLPQSRFGPRDFGTFPIPIISDLVGIGPIIGGLGISKSRFCQHRL